MNLQEINLAISNLQRGVEYDEIEHLRNQISMLEIYGKLRSENCHSQFLKWLFEDGELNSSKIHGAVYRLIYLIQKWSRVQNVEKFPTIGKKSFSSIISFTLHSIKVSREYPIETTEYENGNVDLVIECMVNCGKKKDYNFNIIIENKVDAKETTKENKTTGEVLYQTDAYVEYFDHKFPNSKNIFVFLTPIPTQDLLSINSSPNSSHSKRYVHINYQELYDGVLLPLYSLSAVSKEKKLKIEDYIKAISKPSSNSVKAKSSLIMTQKEIKLLIDFYDNNKALIMDAILAKSRDKNEVSNQQAYIEAWSTLGGVSTDTYKVNGKIVGKMWEVVRKFVEMLLGKKWSTIDIENEIRKMVGTPKTKTRYFDTSEDVFNKYSNGSSRCKKMVYKNKTYYLTDQWGGTDNFPEFVKNVNAKYNKTFNIS